MGDDIVDVPVMHQAGFAASVADACQETREEADFVSKAPGGHGAARELIELTLRAQEKWEDVVRPYFRN